MKLQQLLVTKGKNICLHVYIMKPRHSHIGGKHGDQHVNSKCLEGERERERDRSKTVRKHTTVYFLCQSWMQDTTGKLHLQIHIAVSFKKNLCIYSCTQTHNTNNCYIYQRHSLCGLELYWRSDWRATALDMYQSFFDTTLCVYTASPHIHHYLVRNYT